MLIQLKAFVSARKQFALTCDSSYAKDFPLKG